MFLLILTISALVFFRVARPRDLLAYYGMATECHPVWRQFAFRRVRPGDNSAEFLSRFPPSRTVLQGEVTTYDYYSSAPARDVPFTGITVAARDGFLVGSWAWSCSWQFTFFDQADLLGSDSDGHSL